MLFRLIEVFQFIHDAQDLVSLLIPPFGAHGGRGQEWRNRLPTNQSSNGACRCPARPAKSVPAALIGRAGTAFRFQYPNRRSSVIKKSDLFKTGSTH